jgi:hypothetical protein
MQMVHPVSLLQVSLSFCSPEQAQTGWRKAGCQRLIDSPIYFCSRQHYYSSDALFWESRRDAER